jgi:hypothetical protein
LKAEEIKGELSNELKFTSETGKQIYLVGVEKDEKDDDDDTDGDPVKVPNRRLSTRFNFFAV